MLSLFEVHNLLLLLHALTLIFIKRTTIRKSIEKKRKANKNHPQVLQKNTAKQPSTASFSSSPKKLPPKSATKKLQLSSLQQHCLHHLPRNCHPKVLRKKYS